MIWKEEEEEKIEKMFETESFFSQNEQNMAENYRWAVMAISIAKIKVKISKEDIFEDRSDELHQIKWTSSGMEINISAKRKGKCMKFD